MSLPKEYILPEANVSTLSVFDLLKHASNGDFIERKDFRDIYPVSLVLNAGVFTKTASAVDFPKVAVSQVGNSIYTSCSCGSYLQRLCEHQAEIIHSILEQRNYRIFFDHHLRHNILLPKAKGYGLDKEPNLDSYFQLSYQNGQLHIEPTIDQLLQVDGQDFKKQLLPQRQPVLKELATRDTAKRRVLVICRHRYYNQLNFMLMEADMTQAGKIKNPVNEIYPMPLAWRSDAPAEIKFYTAIAAFHNRHDQNNIDSDINAVRQIIANPLELDVYYHDRNISETILAKSLQLIKLNILKAEIQLTVFKKEIFYEITGELLFNELSIPFKNVVIRNEYFVYHRETLHLIDNPDMLRVIKFFKSNNETLLVHASKYDEFLQTVLTSLEHIAHINYSYIRQATPAQLAEKETGTERIIYLQQAGNFVSITPVMKYGAIEVPVFSRKQLIDTDPNGNEFIISRDNEAEIRLTTLVMEQHPDFREQIDGHEYFYLHSNRFLDDSWFLDAFETWRDNGIKILGFNELKNNKLSPHRAKISIEVSSGTDWFNAKLKVSFGKKKAALKQVHRAIRNKSKFILLDDGTQGVLPAEWIDRITRYFQVGDIDDETLKIPKINFSEISYLFEKEILSKEVQSEITTYGERFSSIKHIPEVDIPLALQTKLRDYQQDGLNWLNFLDNFNFGGCLADDMGLGKTVQIIAFILSQREKHGHVTNLVVAPTSLLFNWQEELLKFAPSVKVLGHYGPDRNKGIKDYHNYEVVLTSYGTLLSDIRFLKTFHFNYIFLDESQAIKNPNSERYKAARLLQSRNKIILTGTPVENNTFDLYGQLSFACPGLLGSKQYFRDTYAIPIDKFEYSKRALELNRKIAPFMLRRTKKQVVKELPEKTEMIVYCEMNTEQRKIYDTYERELREFISAANEEEIQKKSMHVLTGLTKLRQICNSPVLLKDGYSGENAVKIEVLAEQIENKSKEHKILVFSQFVGMLSLIKDKLTQKNISFEYLDGQTKDRGVRVHHFQSDDNIRVFLISLKAGGIGLNLTGADYVYLVDPWWNPAVENQAIDRSYRIGQDKNVIAVRLICLNTIEEKIMNLQKKKSRLSQNLLRTETSFIKSLSKNDLLEIL